MLTKTEKVLVAAVSGIFTLIILSLVAVAEKGSDQQTQVPIIKTICVETVKWHMGRLEQDVCVKYERVLME